MCTSGEDAPPVWLPTISTGPSPGMLLSPRMSGRNHAVTNSQVAGKTSRMKSGSRLSRSPARKRGVAALTRLRAVRCIDSRTTPASSRRSGGRARRLQRLFEPVVCVGVVVVPLDRGVPGAPVHRYRIGEHTVGVEPDDRVAAIDGPLLERP